jgi:hypothetical protein
MGCRDLVAPSSNTKVAMLPGGAAAFSPVLQDVQGGAAGIKELAFNRASTRAYAVANVSPNNDVINHSVVAFTTDHGTLQLLNSVRCLWFSHELDAKQAPCLPPW